MEALLEREETKEIEKESTDLVTQAQGLQIRTVESYKSAVDFLKSLKSMQKRVAETFEKSVKKAYDSWKESVALRDSFANPLKNAESLVKGKMQEYDREQERIAAEAQAKIDAQARKEREEAEERAKKWADKGNIEKAEEIRQKAESKPVPVVEKAVPVVNGIKYVPTYEGKQINPALVEKQWWIINDAAVQAFIKSTKGQVPVPGYEIIIGKRIASGSR